MTTTTTANPGALTSCRTLDLTSPPIPVTLHPFQSNTDTAQGFVSGYFYGELEDGEIRLQATGEDAQGPFIDDIRFTDIEADSFTWRMSRSYDDGKTWRRDQAVTRARRVR